MDLPELTSEVCREFESLLRHTNFFRRSFRELERSIKSLPSKTNLQPSDDLVAHFARKYIS